LEKGGGQFLVRPGAEEFLKNMAKFYEVVIFTAALPDYANFILDIIDKWGSISYRLYREHTVQRGNYYLKVRLAILKSQKDLSLLGRSLTKTIIVDNLPENFQLQAENGIFISSWMGDPTDRALKDLAPLLEGNLTIDRLS
jgi:CTD small phosphatase-like protein 2